MQRNIVIALLVSIVLVAILNDQTSVEASPGRGRGGGGGRGRSSGGWFGSSSGKKSGGGWFGGSSKSSGGYGKKKSRGSMLKKAAVIGVTAYGSYKIGKLAGRFSGYGHHGGFGYGFNDWNRWRAQDGFLCRDSNDCQWIDRNLYCQDYELDFTPSALWFGGDVARIVGECDCSAGMYWDDRDIMCRASLFGGIGVVLVVIIALLILTCCCVAGIFFLKRR